MRLICTRVQTGCAGDAPGCKGKNVPGCRGCRRTRVQIPGKPIYQRLWSLIGNSSFSRVKLPRAESTSFTSMGSQVRVLLRPPQTLENTTFSRVFHFLRMLTFSFWRAEMSGIHHAVHIENQMISERYILLPCPEGCSKSGVFTVLHNKAPAF